MSRTPDSTPVLSLSGVDFSTTHGMNESLTPVVMVTSKYPIGHVDFFINGELIDKKTTSPYSFSFNPSNITSISNNNSLTFIAYDTFLNKGTFSTQLLIQ